MARIGGPADDYNKEAAALEAAMKARKGTAAAEVEMSGALDKASGSLENATQKTRLYRKAKQEADELAQRSAKVHIEDARAIDVETAAVERNAKARARAAALQRGAVHGANDPLFARAYGMADPVTGVSQTQLRRQLQVGQSRAAALQAAVAGGFTPAPRQTGALHGPLTAAQDADLAYADAMKRRRRALQKQDQAGLQSAETDLELARARKSEIKAAQQRAVADREAAAQAAGARTPGMALVPRTREVAGPDQGSRTGRFYGGAPGATVPPEQYGVRQPVREVNAGGTVGEGRSTWVTKSVTAATRERNAAMKAEADLQGRIAQNETMLNELRSVAAQREVELAAATRRTGAEYGASSQQMLRHGALSSEFIQAAVKGQTSIREIGQQALITAGKFGAWTLAATAVYGVVRAIGTVGQGAIQGQSGAYQLRRVIPHADLEQAGKDFNQLSGQFNVPIKDSADAVYRMGQVFHDQAAATTAAKAALYSYQTGEVDVATSTTNLISIQKGFGLSSNDLLSVYDQINQAQNTFGVKIGDTESGLAKAAGTFRNAGGDLDYLLGLFVAINKATGRPGTEIGTGIARAANQIRKPAAQAALRAQGVDVDPNNLQLTMQRAIARARKPGADYNAIAAGVFGNQYARLFAPVLRDPSTLQDALGKTGKDSPGVRGSAERELAQRRKQIDYQITQIGVNMGRIGEALGRSGAFTGLGIIVKMLNQGLQAVNGLINAFDKLPAPVRTLIVLLGEAYALMRVMRRFGVADRIGAGFGHQGSRDRLTNRGINAGLESAEQAARNEAERLSRQSVTAVTTAQNLHQTGARARGQFDADVNSGAIKEGTKEYEAAQRKVIAAEQRAAVAANRSAELEVAVADQREQLLLLERDIVNMKKIEAEAGTAAALAYAEQQHIYGRTPGGAVFGPGAAGAVTEKEAAKIAEEDAAKRAAAIEAANASRTLGPVEKAVAPYSSALRGVQGPSGSIASRVLPIAGLSGKAGGALDAGARGLQKLGGGIKGLFGGLARFGAALGPLDLALIGFVAFEFISSKADEANKALSESEKRLDAMPRSQAQQDARLKKKTPDPGSFGVHAATWFSNPFGVRTLAAAVTGDEYESPIERAKRLQHEHDMAIDENNRILGLQNAARRRGPGHAIPLQFYGQITKEMAEENRKRVAGVISQREFDKQLAKNLTEIKTGRGDDASRNRAMAVYEDFKRKNAPTHAFGDRYKGLDLKGLGAEMEASAQLAQGHTDVGLHLREVSFLYQRTMDTVGNQKDAQSLAAVAKARKLFYDTVESATQQELQTALLSAHTEPARQAAFARAAQGYRKITRDARGTVREDNSKLARLRGHVAGDQQALDLAKGTPALGDLGGGIGAGSHLPGIIPADGMLRRIKDALKQDGERIKNLLTKKKRDEKALKDAEEQQKIDELQLRDQRYQDREQGRQIDLAYQQSKTTDPGKQAADAVKSARKGVADAARTYGVGSREWKQAMTTLNTSKHQRDQTIVDSTDAENALMEASAALSGDSVDVAKAAERAAINTLNAARKAGLDANTIKKDLAAVIQARVATRQAVSQQNQQMVASQGAVRSAYATGDPTGEAGLKADVTNANNAYNQVAGDKTLHGRDRTIALNNANAARIQANIALKNYYIQQAEEMRQLSFQLKASKTDDPIAKARIAYFASLDALRSARTPQQRIQAQVQARDNLRAWKDAKIQGREDDIDFDLEMNKISRDDAITRYQALLRNSDLTKAERRDIQRKIKQLRDDSANAASGFDLDVGSIKLPTIYDVRRAIGELKPGGSKYAQGAQPVQNRIDVNVNINDQKTRVDVTTLDTATSTTVPASMAQAGLTL